jgi:hypothetical protein
MLYFLPSKKQEPPVRKGQESCPGAYHVVSVNREMISMLAPETNVYSGFLFHPEEI